MRSKEIYYNKLKDNKNIIESYNESVNRSKIHSEKLSNSYLKDNKIIQLRLKQLYPYTYINELSIDEMIK